MTVAFESRPSGQKEREVGVSFRKWFRKIRRVEDVQCCEELSLQQDLAMMLLYEAERAVTDDDPRGDRYRARVDSILYFDSCAP